jgi:hypothetical protein
LTVRHGTANTRGFGIWVLADNQTLLGSDLAAKVVCLGYLKGGTIFKGNIFSILTEIGRGFGGNSDCIGLQTPGDDRDRAQ